MSSGDRNNEARLAFLESLPLDSKSIKDHIRETQLREPTPAHIKSFIREVKREIKDLRSLTGR